jgi:hypothetical protein
MPPELNVISFPRPSRRVDESVRSIVAALETQLALARNGKLRSIALASVSSDGAAIRMGCSCDRDDVPGLTEVLDLLARDIAGA